MKDSQSCVLFHRCGMTDRQIIFLFSLNNCIIISLLLLQQWPSPTKNNVDANPRRLPPHCRLCDMGDTTLTSCWIRFSSSLSFSSTRTRSDIFPFFVDDDHSARILVPHSKSVSSTKCQPQVCTRKRCFSTL